MGISVMRYVLFFLLLFVSYAKAEEVIIYNQKTERFEYANVTPEYVTIYNEKTHRYERLGIMPKYVILYEHKGKLVGIPK